jgi:hypothetical protein
MRHFSILFVAVLLLVCGCKKAAPAVPPVEPVLKVDQTPVSARKAGGDYTVSIQSNGLWMATVEYSEALPLAEWWIELSGSGQGSGILTVRVAGNPATKTREATLFVEMDDIKLSVPVSQEAGDPSFTVSPTEILDVPAAGGTHPVSISSNLAWSAEITSGSDFVTFQTPENPDNPEDPETPETPDPAGGSSRAEGVGNGSFMVEIAENTSPDERTATITLTTDGVGVASVTIPITQSGRVESPEPENP